MNTLVAGACLATALLTIEAAHAAPLSPATLATGAGVVMVAQGCGIGFKRGPNNACRPQTKSSAIQRLVARNRCPVGYRVGGLFGKCRRN
jgi:hypothetical protein